MGQFPSSKLFCQKHLCMGPLVESKYGATTETAESLIAQIDSQSKLATPRRKNRKIWHENKILRANENASGPG
jgi:hypothetical protein